MAGKHHRDAAFVGRGDYLLIAQAASGLDYGRGAGIGDDVEAVAKGEKRIRRNDRSGEGKLRAPGLDNGDAGGIDSRNRADLPRSSRTP